MMVVARRIVLSCRMLVTGSTQRVVVEFDFGRMRVVAVRATYPVMVHLALDKRTVDVIFIANLPVDVINRIRDQLRRKIVIKITAGLEPLADN